MYGDFSRDSFDPCKHYTRVLMQQGRPLTDADWNEQVAILWRHVKALATSFIGWHGTGDRGFALENGKILPGQYFVDGIMAENENVNTPLTAEQLPKDNIAYLDVWEDTVHAIADPGLLEPALNGIDTSVRLTTRWALRKRRSKPTDDAATKDPVEFIKIVTGREKLPVLKVSQKNERATDAGPCDHQATSGAGVGDCLYRVEIHRQGKAATTETKANDIDDPQSTIATFKWSRVNGAAVTRIEGSKENKPTGKVLASRNDVAGGIPIRQGSWIELMDFDGRSVNSQRRLLKVESFVNGQITLTEDAKPELDENDVILASYNLKESSGYFVRQWDHSGVPLSKTVGTHEVNGRRDNRILSNEGTLVVIEDGEIELENGIVIYFTKSASDKISYRSGDYWLIRTTSSGRVAILPSIDKGSGLARNEHHYAPLFSNPEGQPIESFRSEFIESGGSWPPVNRTYFRTSGSCNSPAPAPNPAPVDAARPVNPSVAVPATCTVPTAAVIGLASILSDEGADVFKKYVGSPQDVTRRIPARYLNSKPTSPIYSRFRAPLLVSEILEGSFEKYFAKVERCLAMSEAERPRIEADARADYALAIEFERMLLAGEGARGRLA